MKKSRLFRSALSAIALAAALPAAASAAVISGRVSDQSKTFALEGAVVRIVETGATTQTDRAGSFRFADVPAGTYNLEISYLGADPVTVSVTIADSDAQIRQDVALGQDVALMDNILVIGQRGAMTSGLNRARAADDLRTVLSADAIGQFPDENVAEAVRRAVGVNVLNDQGEGRFVSIRGLDPNLSSTTINGVRIPSPEGSDRNVPLDVIDSDLLSAVVVNKSLTPDVDGDSIGGNVEIETLSGLDQQDMLVKLKAAGTFANLVDGFGQKYAGTFANNFMENRLGVAASVSYRRRDFGSDNVESDDWFEEGGVAVPGEVELRDYDIVRERLSASLNIDYRPNDGLELYLRGLFSSFRDQEFRSSATANFADAEFDRIENNIAIVNATEDDPFEVERALKDREETQIIASVSAGGAWLSGPWTVEWAGAYSYADEKEIDRIDSAFVAEFEAGAFGVDVANPLQPRITIADAMAESAFFDAENFEFDELIFLNGKTTDEEFAFNLDGQYDTDLFGNPGYVKAGGKIRMREKDRNVLVDVFDGFDGDGFDPLSAVSREISQYRLGRFGPAPDGATVRDFFFANRDGFEQDAFDTLIDSNIENYVAQEDIYAGYVMAKVDIDKLRLVGGVRIEHTEFDSQGTGIIEFEQVFAGDVEDTVSLADLNILVPGAELISDLDADFDSDDGETTVEAIFRTRPTAKQSYTDWLPSLNVRYEARDDLVTRFAYYKSVVRPNIEAVVPAAEIAQEEDELEATLGNPDLKRQRAHNVDASVAYYPNRDSVMMLGLFYKRISDFIAFQTFEDFDFNGLTFNEATIAVNLDSVDLIGVEANYQQQFSFLPAPFDGFLAGANYTFVDADVALTDGRTINLPRQSRHVGNLMLGYEKGRFNLRAVATYRDGFVDEINAGGDGVDRLVASHFQIDLSAKFRITEQLRAYVDAKNINNEPFVAFFSDGGPARLNSQFEEYGFSLEFGVTYTY